MKLVSWNVNGLRAAVSKGLKGIISDLDADIFCVQEIKLKEGQIDFSVEGYTSFWSYADRPGYSGTAVLTRLKPNNDYHKIGIDKHDHEGRVVALEYDNFWLVNVYVPNSQNELARLGYRMDWEEDFRKFIVELDGIKPVVICGDMNVAHREIDLARPGANVGNAGFTPQERHCMDMLLNAGFIDTFRFKHPNLQGAYSWWSYRGGARSRNVGWRIDYFLVSERLKDKIVDADIRPDIIGSDHCPVTLEIDL